MRDGHTVSDERIAWIRGRFDKNDRMNCRDILDLIEYIDQLKSQLSCSPSPKSAKR